MTKKADIWDNDLLGRERDSAYLYSLIKNRSKKQKTEGSVVVNIDARWGQGKSFFLHNMYRQVLAEGHPAISINAWKYDYVDDPYTYVMSELERYFQSLVDRQQSSIKEKIKAKAAAVRDNAGKLLWLGIKGVGKRASRYAFGAAADEMVEVVEQYAPAIKSETEGVLADVEKQLVEVTDEIIGAYIKKRLDDFQDTKEALQSFRDSLEALVKLLEDELKMKMPMFIFIDELDRCRPPYAIQMMERIKHLFDVPQLAFVIATDTTSLSHSVQAVYGPKFDGREYLGRFFHRTYKLPSASRKRIISAMIIADGIDLNRWRYPAYNTTLETYSEFIDLTAGKFDLSIRQVEQSLHILFDITFAHDERFTLEIIYLYTLICYSIKHGTLDKSDWSEISSFMINFGDDWFVELSSGPVGFFEIIQRIRKISEMSINDALADLSDKAREIGDAESSYFYEAIKVEYHADSGRHRLENTDYDVYFDLINHAKNSYIDDQVGTEE
ncbi:KAP family NTPase [Agrobacterium sp. MAFF310724]|uniref:KAP family P-loop NTPase fold protein n=1 Tax=Agrobacterium TaxID=357 RepID=UPI001386EFB2|nr:MULTISPECIES: P-loop NTPase fold protein [Agrobacterium]MDA5241026.1 KAP family NTPase [Agrobacterium sp. MAFF310724]MDA5249742.1 KAP family NTPase [Agrobacterium sp. MAFF210268]